LNPLLRVITTKKPIRRFVQKFRDELFKLLTVLLFYTVGIFYYRSVEDGWSTADTIYFITVSITTVGYGDFHPTKDGSKIFTVFFVLFGILTIFATINEFAVYIIRSAEEKALANLKKGDEANKEPYKQKIAFSILMIVVCVFLGSIFFMENEDWSFVDAFYWSFITTMTVGYGDLTLEKESSRVFSIFYIIVSVISVAAAIGNIGSVQVAISLEKKRNAMLTRKLDLAAIIAMDTDGGGVDRVEFLTAMLVQMNDLDKEKDIDPWLKRFDELDKDGSGTLDEEDLRLFEEEEKQRRQALKKKLVVDDEDEDMAAGEEGKVLITDQKNPLRQSLIN